jgi:uncharacterized protein (DUF488 family)
MIYTTGYTGKKPEDLKRLVERLGARLLDIRYSANSRVPHWRQKALAELVGDAYYNLIVFGNRAYQEGRIEIVNFASGENWLFFHLKDHPEQPLILMCACKDYETCHRKVVADGLRERGYEVEELATWDAELPLLENV